MAKKTYLSHKHPFLSIAFTDKSGKGWHINFANGEYSTDNPEIQSCLEDHDRFGEDVTLKPSELESAKSKAVELRALAVKANALAKAAEDLVVELTPKTVKA